VTTTLETGLSLKVHTPDAEGPTTWHPSIPREAALEMLDHAIARIRGQLSKVEEMRALVADETRGGWVKVEPVAPNGRSEP
jgi:hypothetical protein